MLLLCRSGVGSWVYLPICVYLSLMAKDGTVELGVGGKKEYTLIWEFENIFLISNKTYLCVIA